MFVLRESALTGGTLTARTAALLVSLAAALLFSLAAAVSDYKTRTVPLWLLLAGGFAGAVLSVAAGRDIWDVLRALLPGGVLFLMNRLTGKIGGGDVGFVLALSLLLSLRGTLVVLMTAFFLAAIVSLGIIAAAMFRGQSVRGKSLPFLCFFPPGVMLWIISIYGQV